VVVIDDYGHFEGARRAVDEFLAARAEPVLLSHIDYTGRFWLKI
jgi:O-methyltransferase